MKKIILVLFSFSLSTAWCATAFSQNVGVNATGNAPDASAMLDVESTDKGILIPRVSLSDTADVTTIASPATSLVVYNDDATPMDGGVGAGFYSYNGSKWVPLIQATNSPGANGQVLTSNGTGVLPEWETFTVSGGGGGDALGAGSCSDCPTETYYKGTIAVTDWMETAKYCSTLAASGGGWRLPTFDELTYLFVNGYTEIGPNSIAAVTTDVFTATKAESTLGSWVVFDLQYGLYLESAATTSMRVLCIR